MLALLSEAQPVHAQRRFRAPIWFSGSDSTDIAGLALHLANGLGSDKHVRTYGISCEIGLGFWGMIGLHGDEMNDDTSKGRVFSPPIEHQVNGINLSGFGSIGGQEVRGINMTLGTTLLVRRIDGLSASGLFNMVYEMNGLSLAPLGNESRRMRGVQIGLQNYSRNTRGVQIGLWNRNERRGLPLINWNFRAAPAPQPADSSSAK